MNKKIIFSFIFLNLSLVLFNLFKQNKNFQMGHSGSSETSIDNQMIKFLQYYVKIDTTHPKPDYDKAIDFLRNQAQRDGFLSQEIKLTSGKKVLVITYPGKNYGKDKNLKSLALNHHMDVVPADGKNWIKPPFSGEIYNDSIIGRGTQDMKGIAAVHYFALKQLKDSGITPNRTIHIFAVPDEEIGGFSGTKEFVETNEFKSLNVGYVLDEGHASGDSSCLDIKVAERKPIQVQITSLGKLYHGSKLMCDNSIHNLINFLKNIVDIHTGQQLKIKNNRTNIQAGELLSCNITSLTSGVKKENGHTALNMVPDVATATIDFRVPCSMKNKNVISMFENILVDYPAINYEILAQATEEPEIVNFNNEFYQTLVKTIKKFNLESRPHFFEASSDLRFYQDLGILGLGLTPFTIEDNIHGTNESVPVNELINAKNIVLQFLKDFCT